MIKSWHAQRPLCCKLLTHVALYMTLQKVLILFKSAICIQVVTRYLLSKTINCSQHLHSSGGNCWFLSPSCSEGVAWFLTDSWVTQYWPGLQNSEHVLQRQMIFRILNTRIEINDVLEGLSSDKWKSVWVHMYVCCGREIQGTFRDFFYP